MSDSESPSPKKISTKSRAKPVHREYAEKKSSHKNTVIEIKREESPERKISPLVIRTREKSPERKIFPFGDKDRVSRLTDVLFEQFVSFLTLEERNSLLRTCKHIQQKTNTTKIDLDKCVSLLELKSILIFNPRAKFSHLNLKISPEDDQDLLYKVTAYTNYLTLNKCKNKRKDKRGVSITWLKNNTFLKELACKTSFTDMDVLSSCINLTSLTLVLTENVKISNLPKLEQLTIEFISEVEPMINIYNLPNLRRVELILNCEVFVPSFERCPKLEEVIIECREENTPPFTYFATPNTVTKLQAKLTRIGDISAIGKFVSLKELTLSARLRKGASLDCLAGCINLEALTLDINSYGSYIPIINMTKLARLSISANNSNENEGLPSLPCSLRELDIYQSKFKDVDNLKCCPDLSDLLLNCRKLRNFTGLIYCTKLKCLNLKHCTYLTSLEDIAGCVNLTELNLSGTKVTSLEHLIELTQLEELNISGTKVTTLQGLEKCNQLKRLKAEECSKLCDISAIEALTKLKIVKMSGLTLLEGVNLLQLSKLRILHLRCIKNMKTFPSLTSCTKLEHLNLRKNVSLTELPVLSACKQLISVDASECHKLKSIEGLRDCFSVRNINIHNTCVKYISLLALFPNLSTLAISDMVKDMLQFINTVVSPTISMDDDSPIYYDRLIRQSLRSRAIICEESSEDSSEEKSCEEFCDDEIRPAFEEGNESETSDSSEDRYSEDE